MKNARHFVGYVHPAIDPTNHAYARVRLYFGEPDFVHLKLDRRAVAEFADGDEVIYAPWIDPNKVSEHAYDDSAEQ
jgi:hypothetical protein